MYFMAFEAISIQSVYADKYAALIHWCIYQYILLMFKSCKYTTLQHANAEYTLCNAEVHY